MSIEIGSWVKVVFKEQGIGINENEIGFVVGQGSSYDGMEPFVTAVEFGKNKTHYLQTKNLAMLPKGFLRTSLKQQQKVFDKMLKNSEDGVDLMTGLYYTTSKGRKPIKEITKHTFKNHLVEIEE